MRNIVYLCVILCIPFLLILPAAAEEFTYFGVDIGEGGIENKWNSFTDSLPEEIREELDGLDFCLTPGVSEEIREKTGFAYWVDKLGDAVISSLGKASGGLSSLFGLLLIMAAANITVPDNPGLASAFGSTAKLVCAVLLITGTSSMISVTEEYLDSICGVMNMLTPIIDAIFLTSGELTQAGVAGAALMLGVTLVGNAAGGVLIPVTEVLFTLSAVSLVCDEVKIGGIASSVRRFLMRIWQVICIFFSFMLASQTTLARHADDLAMRGAKFAIGTFVPMAGGMISEAFGTLRAGVAFLRTTAGIGGIIAILLLTLPGIVPLLICRLGLTLTAEGAKILRLDSAAAMFDEIGGITELLIGITLCTMLMFVFAVIIFAKIGAAA